MKSQLTDHLWIGNWQDAKNSNGSHYVITVAHDSPFVGNEHYPLVDGPADQRQIFYNAVKATVDAIEQGKPVLVNCHGGRSRSAAVCVAALALFSDENVYSVYEKVIAAHPETRIHPALALFL